MATEGGAHEAHEVSEAFVAQYYHIVGNLTHEAHKLYVDASVVSRPGPDGTMMSFTSIEDINKHFVSCGSTTTTFEVLSVDTQSSMEEGIFIMVIGFLIGEDNLRRKFSQMFYLARQNTTYVVVNDIFRYVDDEESSTPAPTTLPAAVVESVPETEVVEPVHAPAEVKNVSEVKEVASTPLDNGSVKNSADEAVTAQKPKETVAEAAPAPVNGAKKSFAAMVESMARSSAPFQVKAAPVVKRPSYVAAPPKPREAAAPAPKAPAPASKRERRNDQRIVDEPGTSIFVSNLPMDAMPPQLHELFKEFGSIKEHGVQVRSSNARGTCFGFVAFESVSSVQSVLEAAKNNPFKLGDRKLRVKEKQVEYDGSKPSGGRKTENGSSADGSKPSGVKSGGGGSKSEENGTSATDGSKTENGSAAGAEDDFKPIRSRRNRSERKGNNGNEKNGGVQTTPKPKA